MGLNLAVANHVILADPWWNAAAEDQVRMGGRGRNGRGGEEGDRQRMCAHRLTAA